ncbi:MAG: hypothetical protein GX363_01805 [Clostridiales bacterium]|jgi:septum formation topological specificity factor MinE|nr:hypothetical protein [Clostridiales bacterium]
MKQLIVLAAILPLMLIFMAQYTLDQKNSATISILQEQVYTAKEKAKQEGCFTEEIKNELKENISRLLDIDKEEINIDATESRQYRINYFDPSRKRGIIHYSVSVPIKKIMAGGNIMGIGKDKNTAVYTVSGSTASEYLPE